MVATRARACVVLIGLCMWTFLEMSHVIQRTRLVHIQRHEQNKNENAETAVVGVSSRGRTTGLVRDIGIEVEDGSLVYISEPSMWAFWQVAC